MSQVIMGLRSERSRTEAEVEYLEKRLAKERKRLEDVTHALEVLIGAAGES